MSHGFFNSLTELEQKLIYMYRAGFNNGANYIKGGSCESTDEDIYVNILVPVLRGDEVRLMK